MPFFDNKAIRKKFLVEKIDAKIDVKDFKSYHNYFPWWMAQLNVHNYANLL